jgi:hypothetical protein
MSVEEDQRRGPDNRISLEHAAEVARIGDLHLP